MQPSVPFDLARKDPSFPPHLYRLALLPVVPTSSLQKNFPEKKKKGISLLSAVLIVTLPDDSCFFSRGSSSEGFTRVSFPKHSATTLRVPSSVHSLTVLEEQSPDVLHVWFEAVGWRGADDFL